jgi:hypothetical protein
MCGTRRGTEAHIRRFEGESPSIWQKCDAAPEIAPHIPDFEGTVEPELPGYRGER